MGDVRDGQKGNEEMEWQRLGPAQVCLAGSGSNQGRTQSGSWRRRTGGTAEPERSVC